MKKLIILMFISLPVFAEYYDGPGLDSSSKLFDYNGEPSLDSSNKLYGYPGDPSLDSSNKLYDNPPSRYEREPAPRSGPRGYDKPRGTQDRYKTDRW